MELTENTVLEFLRAVQDPELGLSIVDLGLVYGADIENQGRKITVRMTLTSPKCPYGPMLIQEVEEALKVLPGLDEGRVQLVWEPQWNPKTMASDEVKDMMGIW